MTAIEFINTYDGIVDTIEKVSRDEYGPAIKRLRDTDPHDLITPSGYFENGNAAYGYVLRLMLKYHKG
jgi:hypothetical protein